MSDPYSYAAPARVKTLFLPLDDLPKETFMEYYDTFEDQRQIKLVDVTPSQNGEANKVNKFSPQGFPLGSVFYDHQLTEIDNQEIFLQDFEPFRKIFIVLGFVKYTDSLTLEKLELHLKNLKKVFRYSIVHNIIVFDSDDPSLKVDNSVFHVPKAKTSAMEYSIMCDITSNFLEELNSYAQSFQHVTLRSPGSINSNDVMKVHLTNHTSAFENQDPIVDIVRKPTLKTNEKMKDSKNKGRHMKILGNFYLLAGRYTDALREFGEALPLLKSSNDYLWLGNTLEYIAICLVLLSHLNVPYSLPQTLTKFLSSKDKSSSEKPSPNGSPKALSRSGTTESLSANSGFNSTATASKTISMEKLNLQVPEIVSQLTHKFLTFYQTTFTNHEDYVPQLVYCDAILRFLKFMTIIHVANGFTANVLNHVVLEKPIEDKKTNEFFFTKQDIFKFSNKIFTVNLENMNLSSQCKIYCCLASIYDDLELYRKKTFILRTLFVKLIPELSKSNSVKQLNGVEDEDEELITRSAEIFEKHQQLQTQVELNNKLLNEVDADLSGTHPSSDNFLIKLLSNLLLIYGIGTSPKNSTNNYKKNPWFQIHKSILYLCIDICKSIIEFNGIVLFSSILLTKYLNTLSPQEQLSLASLISESQQKAKNVNKIVPCHYWDPFLVRDITLLNEFDETLAPIKLKELPTGTNTTIEAPSDNSSSSLVKGKKSFGSAVIYNPFEENKRIQAKLQRRSSKRLSSGLGLRSISQSRKASSSGFEAVDASLSSVTSSIKEESSAADTVAVEDADDEEETEYEDVIEHNYDDEGVLLVEGEIFTLLVKVQNPFKFEIELSEVSIETNEEVKLETLVNNNQNHFTINPESVTTLRIAVRPLNYGELKIIGAEIKVNSCEKQLFKIIHREKYEVLEKVKKVGIEANLPIKRSTKSSSGLLSDDLVIEKISNRVDFKNLNLVVISPQPILSLIDLSLNNGWIMLLEGEKSSFKILLKNLSNIKINYLAFSFLDSTIEPLTKAIQSKDLPVNEIYEIEYYLLKRKPLRIQKSEINKLKFIKPLDYLNLSFDIKGKRGMRDAHIILDYGNQNTIDLNTASSEEVLKAKKHSNYFRRISIPLSVTVSPSVELAGCDLIPLFNNVNKLGEEKIVPNSKMAQDMLELASEQKNIWRFLNQRTDDIGQYCLLVIDLRNSWNQKFKVTLNSSEFVFPTSEEFEAASANEKATFSKNDDCYSVSETIAPGHTERFILPIKRIEFTSEYLERSIPSLRNKQFIVQDNKYSKEEFKFIREAFWYRKELLRHIKGRWIEEGSRREGYIELRGIRLSQRMVSVLRIEKIGIEMTILDENRELLENNGFYWGIKPEKFITIRTKITNRSNYVLKGFIRHVPTSNGSTPLDRKILYNGVLQLNIGQEGIEPGQSKEFDLGLVILEKGEYEWGAIFDEQIFDVHNNVDLQHTQRVPLFIKVE